MIKYLIMLSLFIGSCKNQVIRCSAFVLGKDRQPIIGADVFILKNGTKTNHYIVEIDSSKKTEIIENLNRDKPKILPVKTDSIGYFEFDINERKMFFERNQYEILIEYNNCKSDLINIDSIDFKETLYFKNCP